MALTGAGLIGFVLVHLAGNLTLFADETGATFDAYAGAIAHNPLLPLAEIGLVVLFGVHLGLGIRVALDNREARKHRYKQLAAHGDRSAASMTMILTGLVIGAFLVVHLLDFRLGNNEPEGLGGRVVERLAGPLGAGIYLVGVVALGIHVWHAFQSVFQTLGFSHPQYRPLLRKAGWGVAVVLALGFGSFPLVFQIAPDSFGQPTMEQASEDGVDQAPPAATEEAR